MYQCTHCGRPADLDTGCPYCGSPAPPLAAELERLDRDIAEMSARDMAIQKERTNLSSKMQAALHQRALVLAAQRQRERRPPKQRGVAARRITTLLPATVRDGRRGTAAQARLSGLVSDRAGTPGVAGAGVADLPQPEASSRSVQNVLLALGALLLGVAALTFTVAVLTALDDVGRAAILVVVCATMLMVPPMVMRRALTATAETVTTVGLILVPLAGTAFWQVEAMRAGLGMSATGYAGLACLVTAAVALAYQSATGLTAPRYVALLALQPTVPLLGYEWIYGPAGWALVVAGIAGADLVAGWAMGRASAPRPVGWLREATWILHGVAVGAALVYAAAALVTAATVPAALRAAAVLLLAAGIGLAGALSLRQRPLPDIAAGLMTLAVIVSAGRVATVALPGRSLVLIAGSVALTAAAVRVLPPSARRGPEIATSGTLAVLGVVVAGAALRAAAAPVRAALPAWEADLSRYGPQLAAAVGTAGWQVAVSALLATVAAALAVPAPMRRVSTVAGVAVTALAAPASFALGWSVTPWVLLVAAVALGITGLSSDSSHAALAHVAAGLVVGLVAAASSLARSELTAGVLVALTITAAAIGATPGRLTGPHGRTVARAAQGAAAAALPGAVATTTAVALPGAGSAPVLAASYLAVSAALGYAALAHVVLRRPNPQLVLGGTLGALAVAVAAFTTSIPDALVATLLLVGALALWLSPSADVGRHVGLWADGADVAAAAVTAGLIGSLARLAVLVAPRTELATTAALVLATALAIRLLPARWRRGPAAGCALGGGVVAAIAGYAALVGGLQVVAAANPVWGADLDQWSATVAAAQGHGGQTPLALLLYAVAVAVVLPLRARAALVPACVALAVIGLPAALALPWWSPMVLGLGVASILGLVAVGSVQPRTGAAWAYAAAALAGFAVAASLVAPWATASSLAGVTTAALVVATVARMTALGPEAILLRVVRRIGPVTGFPTSAGVYVSPTHLVPVGGTAVSIALLALPGALAASSASLSRPTGVVLTTALAATSLGLALVALLRPHARDYLPYAAVGTAVAATAVAVAALATGRPYGVYAAAAALLGVLTELTRTGVAGPPAPPRRISRALPYLPDRSGVLTPGLLATAGVPAVLALASIAPPLTAAVIEPHRTLSHIWQGPQAAGVDWTGTASGAAVAAALVLTLAAALAAAGYGGRAGGRLTRDELLAQVVPVVIPGVALTLLILPAGLGLSWPAGTIAALVVFTISMLGVALSPPPPPTEPARPIRATRTLILLIGLAAGSAGLAGSLADRAQTLATLAGAVGVGVTAALGGRTNLARMLGWAFASVSAHALAYVTGLAVGLPQHWSAFGVLAVAAVALATAATLPRLRQPEARTEASALEWTAYGGAVLALFLAAWSVTHLAALLAAWGAVLGIAAIRPGRTAQERRVLLWTAVAFELTGWVLIMQVADVGVIEAYTLPFAALAVLVGLVELRHHRELGSWGAYGPALGAAFVPTLAIVLATDTGPLRRILLLLGAVATLIAGSVARQRAPVVVGSMVTAAAALHEVITVSVWLIFIPIGILLLGLGATYEKRRRDLQRLRGALNRMR